ncbi:RAD9, HUS1, RAD1-interacting nuclear orphan protein 1 [Parambassis ranga]|uniref:RAD9, HUS1, RAD1-interacting nuclear orphan protein 1 n=1 Tax=Parambassis ranga TaxID=210632 RepID=A0A6P7HR84_9TELE|nr:RAD9, HUS1, RAD1-interacting nuclear orphan protein 1 [Parambassis ranga]XP_028256223.1 RAD9, HUS1, RAD1-interacting nuclear orphan protein 1 [Parambassis ranga]
MPRKVTKTGKPPLLFQEQPVCGAKLQNVPEVRAALNPRDFFTETKAHNSSSLNSWVSPQFDSSVTLPPVRRGRRKCQSTTSILDGCSQLTRKSSVCKFPSLTFQTGSRVPKSTHTKKATQRTDAANQPQGSGRNKKTVSSGQYRDTPKRQLAPIRKTNAKTDPAASHRKCFGQSDQVTASIPKDAGASTPVSNELEVSSVGPPPDVDTPKAIDEGSSCPSTSSVHLLLAQPPCTPPSNQPPATLVMDTPERDYGVKVTWRRRKGLMLLLKDRGHLSESDVLIKS